MSFLAYPPPRYAGSKGQVSATIRLADTPPELDRGTRTHYLATSASTGGEFGLYRVEMPPRAGGPATHFHRTISESFFVLSGTLQFYDGERWTDNTPGDFMYVPVGGLHAFRNTSDEPVSVLMLFAPGAPREGYFEGVHQLANMTEAERQDFLAYHDSYFTG